MNISWFIHNQYFILVLRFLAVGIKAFIFMHLMRQRPKNASARRAYFALAMVLITAIIPGIINITRKICVLYGVHHDLLRSMMLLGWCLYAFRYYYILVFVETFISKKATTTLLQKLLLAIGGLLCSAYVFTGFQYWGISLPFYLKDLLVPATHWYTFIITGLCLYQIYQTWHKKNISKIIKTQLSTIALCVVAPYFVIRLVKLVPYYFGDLIMKSGLYGALASCLTSFAIYYAITRLIQLRLLNMNDHVQDVGQLKFIDDFRIVLDRLTAVKHPRELIYVTRQFFNDNFNIPFEKTALCFRSNAGDQEGVLMHSPVEPKVERFIDKYGENQELRDLAYKHKVLIADEIAFDQFYENTNEHHLLLEFFELINADVFIPIFADDHFTAYILVQKDARKKLYSKTECDQMLVFSQYLANIIDLLQKKNIDDLVAKQQAMKLELYAKHQEVNQYKESIHSLLTAKRVDGIGLFFYKKNKFVTANNSGHQLISIDLNRHAGHPLTQIMKKLVNQVERFGASKTVYAKNVEGESIVLTAVKSFDGSHVIITVSYPDASDILKKQLDQFNEPSQIDYLLYLETTESGKIVNKLIPGGAKPIMEFKLELLKAALNRKAVWLDLAQDDVSATVELLHHVSLRQTLHTLTVKSVEKSDEIGIQLFGINPLFGSPQEPALLLRLDGTGTLFIKNVERLSLATQEQLADYLKYGSYRSLKSEKRYSSDVRIIISSHHNLEQLTHEGAFSPALYDQINKKKLSMAPLYTLSDIELSQLVDDMSQDLVEQKTVGHLLSFTDREKSAILAKKPLSFKELKQYVQAQAKEKSRKKSIFEETTFDDHLNESNPELIRAARLGKYALKDPKIMTMLWKKFDKNQSTIAQFLSVNRSSVNRRCKEYGLE